MAGTFVTYGTLKSGSVVAKTIAGEDIAAKKMAITEALSAIEFAAEKAVVTQALAVKELASQDIVIASLATDDNNDTENVFVINSNDSHFNVYKGSEKIFKLSEHDTHALKNLKVHGDGKIHGHLEVAENFNAKIGKFENLEAVKMAAHTAKLNDLHAPHAKLEALDANTITASNINAALNKTTTAYIDNLNTSQVFAANEISTNELIVLNKLEAGEAHLNSIESDSAKITTIHAENGNVNNLTSSEIIVTGSLSTEDFTTQQAIVRGPLTANDFATNQAVVTGSLCANDFASNQAVVKGPLAADDIASNKLYATTAHTVKIYVSKDLQGSEITLDDAFKFDVKDSTLVVEKGNETLLELSEE